MPEDSVWQDSFTPEEAATEPPPEQHKRRLIVVPIDNYEVVVEVTEDGRLVDVVEIRIKQEFLSPAQRAAASGYHDVESFYEE